VKNHRVYASSKFPAGSAVANCRKRNQGENRDIFELMSRTSYELEEACE